MKTKLTLILLGLTINPFTIPFGGWLGSCNLFENVCHAQTYYQNMGNGDYMAIPQNHQQRQAGCGTNVDCARRVAREQSLRDQEDNSILGSFAQGLSEGNNDNKSDYRIKMLSKLVQMKNNGQITEAEYESLKAQLFAE